MKVLVCGGRDYGDREQVEAVLNRIGQGVTLLIEGGAPGADTLAAEWAEIHGVHTARVNALWKRYGPAAGPLRNAKMLSLQPDIVIAFPGGRGTTDMIRRAEAAGITVRRVPAAP